MSVHFYKLPAVRAKQAAIFNEKESACSKRQHENSQEQSCGASVAPNQGYRCWNRVNILKSATPPPRTPECGLAQERPQDLTSKRKSCCDIDHLWHSTSFFTLPKFGEQTVTCTLRHCGLTSSTDLHTLYLQILCKIFRTLQAQWRREIFKLHATSFTCMLSEPVTIYTEHLQTIDGSEYRNTNN
jgi:hypothetical protein